MAKIDFKQPGALGVIKDIAPAELPMGAWSEAMNIRFVDGAVLQFLGHGQVYQSPSAAPQYLLQANVAGARYWLYATAGKQFAVSNSTFTSLPSTFSTRRM